MKITVVIGLFLITVLLISSGYNITANSKPVKKYKASTAVYNQSEHMTMAADSTTNDTVVIVDDTHVVTEEVISFIQPIEYIKITQPFGQNDTRFHKGIDVMVEEGTEIEAIAGGVVIVSEYDEAYGNYIVIEHNNQYKSLYSKCSKLLVDVGQEVIQGAVIALSGNTGRSTGPHLHFELHQFGEAIDPAMLFGDLNDEE